MPDPDAHRSAFELVEELNSLFDGSDFRAVRTTLEERASLEDARAALGAFQEFLERAVDPELVIDYTRLDPSEINPGGSAIYRGWDGWLEHWRVWFEAWDAIELDRREVEVIDRERVLVWSEGRVRGRGSGAELPWASTFAIWTVEGGKLTRIDGFSTREEALSAAALG